MTERAPASHSKCWRRNSLHRASSSVFSSGLRPDAPAVFARINLARSFVPKSTGAPRSKRGSVALRIVDLHCWIQRFAREPENNQDGQDGTVDYEMPGARQVAARANEAAAGSIDSM